MILTYEQAYLMYIQNRWDDVVPFESEFEEDFISILNEQGYEVLLEEGFQVI